jgi:hypothetical protein
MKIYIPHIHYRIDVSFDSAKYLNEMGMEAACAYLKNGHVKLHFRGKPSMRNAPTVAHEVMHAMQFISKDRGIDMTQELEHFGYMTNFVMNKIFGLEYESRS